MVLILVIVVVWLFFLLLALAILRTAGRAERAAEARLRAEASEPAAAERRRKTVTTAVVLAAMPFAGAAVAAPDADAESCHGARSGPSPAAPSATLCLINAERRARGLTPLGVNARLARAAQRHAADMVDRGYFSHVSPGGATVADRLRRAGYTGGCAWSAGEALAWGTGDLRTPASRVDAWMDSPPHRAILLRPGYREVGIGVVEGSPGDAGSGATYAGEFGRRRC